MSEEKKPGGLGDGVKDDAKDTANKALGDTAGDLSHVDPTKQSVGDIAAELAKKRMEDAKQAAQQMALKNVEILKQMAIAEAMGGMDSALGGVADQVPGGMGKGLKDAAEAETQSQLNNQANNVENKGKKLADIAPSENTKS